MSRIESGIHRIESGMSRVYDWVDERLRIKPAVKAFADHPVPAHVDPVRHVTAFVYCFGGLSFLFLILLISTGIFLTIYYVPSPDHAYESVQYITEEVALGAVVRGIHHWAASGLIIMMLLHMVRVFLSGAYKAPREMNWVVGVLLFVICFAFGFTGYLLPWDQKAYWATVVGTNMVGTVPVVGDFGLKVIRGGDQVGALTLVRFYAGHVWILPSFLFILLGLHFIMVRRQGISGPL